MIVYYDWIGRYKIVTTNGGYCTLCGPNVGIHDWSKWWYDKTGRQPAISTVYEVGADWYDEYKEVFSAKGNLFEGDLEENEL